MPVEFHIAVESKGADVTPKAWKKASTRAMRKAGISGQRAMRAEAIRRVRALKNLRARSVRKSMSTHRSRTGAVEGMAWTLAIDGKPVPLIDYKARQVRRGVTVAVNKGKRTLVKGAFIQVMKSGHKGVFVRRGRGRLPIDERLGSRPVDALRKSGESEAVGERGAKVARRDFARVLPMELAKLKK